jgi:multidrug resistance efflux pump
MKLFTTSDRPDAATMTDRIAELKARETAIAADIEAAEGALAVALATGHGIDEARRSLAALRDESDALPRSIELLEAERAESRRAELAAQIASWEAERDRIADSARRAYADVAKAIERYNEKIAGMTATVPGYRDGTPTALLALRIAEDPAAAFIEDVTRGIAHRRITRR